MKRTFRSWTRAATLKEIKKAKEITNKQNMDMLNRVIEMEKRIRKCKISGLSRQVHAKKQKKKGFIEGAKRALKGKK